MIADKLYIPKSKLRLNTSKSGYVRRNINYGDFPIVLVHGCAGWGKTSFLAQLADDYDGVSIALTLNDDDDAKRLALCFYYALCEEALQSELDIADLSATELVDFCCKKSAELNALILLDGMDRVAEKEACVLLDRIVSGAMYGDYRVATAVRLVPNLMLKHLASGECAEIGTEKLKFGVEETAECFALYSFAENGNDFFGSDLVGNGIAKSLCQYTDGWPVLTAMLIKTVCELKNLTEFSWKSVAEKSYIRRYIQYNIVDGLTDELAEYVKATAFLGKCDSDFCAGVLSITNADELLGYLFKNGILIKCGEFSYSYPEYSTAVKQALCGLISLEQRKKLVESTAEYCIDKKMFAEVFALYDEHHKPDAASNILKRYGRKMLENKELELIGYCSEIIDRYGISSDAEVLGIMAQYYYYNGNYEKMELCYNMADSMFGSENQYSACRSLYNGLLRYDKNPTLYTENVRSAVFYLKEHRLSLPFLYQSEAEALKRITATEQSASDSSKPLIVNRFGSLSVVIGYNGRELQWRTRKASELMAYMIENNGKAIGREALLNLLWPFDMPNNAIAMLHNIIYNIRKELSGYELEKLISYQNKCYTLDMSLILDESAKIDEVCSVVKTGNTQKLLPYAEFVEQYWGAYLQNIDSDWANNAREYYDKCFVEASARLAEHFGESRNFDKELVYLKNIASIEPYSEKNIRNIVYCYVHLGKPDKAKKRYNEYCRLIESELGIEPSEWLKNEFSSAFCSSENKARSSNE